MSCFLYWNISVKASYTKWTHLIVVARVSMFYICWTIESCRISVVCLKQNGALKYLEIKIMMNVYQTVLANTSPNYNVFWVILTLTK